MRTGLLIRQTTMGNEKTVVCELRTDCASRSSHYTILLQLQNNWPVALKQQGKVIELERGPPPGLCPVWTALQMNQNKGTPTVAWDCVALFCSCQPQSEVKT